MPYDVHWQQQYLKTGDYLHEISRGNVRGAYPFFSYGKLITESAATNVLIRSTDGTVLNVPPGVSLQDSSINSIQVVPIRFPEGAIIGFTATTDKSAKITSGFKGWVE